MKKVYIESLGCPKNLVDSELIVHNFAKKNNCVTVQSPDEANIILINTCGFIEPAKEEAINTILEYSTLKDKNIYVTGCLVTRYKDVLIHSIPEIKNFLTVDEAFRYFVGKTDIKELDFSERYSLTPKSYTYVKIADGCNRRCAYCAIPLIRGDYVSRHKVSVIREIKKLAEMGFKEIILVAHDVINFGMDNNENIIQLLEEIEKIDKIYKVRLLYLYPDERILSIVKFIKDSPKFCKYIEMPIQHISSDILMKMRRPSDEKFYFKIIDKIRAIIPDLALRTTFIAGFPGETKNDFDKLKKFLKEIQFNWAGFYQYSDEENTLAYNLPDKLKDYEILRRTEELIEIQKEITSAWLEKRKYKVYDVVIDEIISEEKIALTRSEFEAPEIDGNILVDVDSNVQPGKIIKVKVTESYDYDLKAEKVELSA